MTGLLNLVVCHSCSCILLISVSGKVVSTQRIQVEQIVDQFNIQVCFLSSQVCQLQYSCGHSVPALLLHNVNFMASHKNKQLSSAGTCTCGSMGVAALSWWAKVKSANLGFCNKKRPGVLLHPPPLPPLPWIVC